MKKFARNAKNVLTRSKTEKRSKQMKTNYGLKLIQSWAKMFK